MTKRFTLKQGFNDELDYGVFLLDNGKKLTTDEVVVLLNQLNDENKRIKQVMQKAYEKEKTDLGKLVLKQLLQNIGEL